MMPVESDFQCQRRKTAALDGEWQTATTTKGSGEMSDGIRPLGTRRKAGCTRYSLGC